MLVLSRKVNERIVIGEPPNTISVTVTSIDRGKIRLAIDAPREVVILRKELLTPPKERGCMSWLGTPDLRDVGAELAVWIAGNADARWRKIVAELRANVSYSEGHWAVLTDTLTRSLARYIIQGSKGDDGTPLVSVTGKTIKALVCEVQEAWRNPS